MEGDSTQKQNAPVLCSAGCGFFGNPLTSNMCSKCYRDAQARLQQQQQPPQPTENKSELVKPQVGDQAATASAPAVEQPEEQEQEQNDRRPQTDTTRCFSCNKKVGLLGFKCRCDYVFCSMHRYSDKHDCSFDYKSMNKAALTKANPVVKGSKLEKI
jgi:type IV secretory pathway VirB10-like protein